MEQRNEAGLALQPSQICERTCLRERALAEWTCWSQNKQSLAESALQYRTAGFELQNKNMISMGGGKDRVTSWGPLWINIITFFCLAGLKVSLPMFDAKLAFG
ncbi:hypothetical protein GOBAR_DD36890 [Gossypium barbadense]|nr:hypothetical protein GOBAR_DD36890 [Gossypium barbadense]